MSVKMSGCVAVLSKETGQTEVCDRDLWSCLILKNISACTIFKVL